MRAAGKVMFSRILLARYAIPGARFVDYLAYNPQPPFSVRVFPMWDGVTQGLATLPYIKTTASRIH
jgi:hypothetical protein